MIDACFTHSNVVNTGVTGPNLNKFLHGVDKLLPINLLKSDLRNCNPKNADFAYKIGCYGNIL